MVFGVEDLQDLLLTQDDDDDDDAVVVRADICPLCRQIFKDMSSTEKNHKAFAESAEPLCWSVCVGGVFVVTPVNVWRPENNSAISFSLIFQRKQVGGRDCTYPNATFTLWDAEKGENQLWNGPWASQHQHQQHNLQICPAGSARSNFVRF